MTPGRTPRTVSAGHPPTDVDTIMERRCVDARPPPRIGIGSDAAPCRVGIPPSARLCPSLRRRSHISKH